MIILLAFGDLLNYLHKRKEMDMKVHSLITPFNLMKALKPNYQMQPNSPFKQAITPINPPLPSVIKIRRP